MNREGKPSRRIRGRRVDRFEGKFVGKLEGGFGATFEGRFGEAINVKDESNEVAEYDIISMSYSLVLRALDSGPPQAQLYWCI